MELNKAVNTKLKNHMHLIRDWVPTKNSVVLSFDKFKDLEKVKAVIDSSLVLHVEMWETLPVTEDYKLHIVWDELFTRMYSECTESVTNEDIIDMYNEWKYRGSK